MSALPLKRKKPRKIAHDLNKGPFQNLTSYKMDYSNRRGKSATPLKASDNLQCGRKFFKNTTYEANFRQKRKTRVKKNFLATSLLFDQIKQQHRGQAFKANFYHPSGHRRSKSSRMITLQPPKYKKDQWHGDYLPLQNSKAFTQNYPGHYQGFAKKNNDRFDNLQTYPDMNTLNMTTRDRFLRGRKNIDFTTNEGLREMIRNFDRSTEKMRRRWKDGVRAETRSQFNERNGEINGKIHTGRDVVAKRELEQLMGGFYYDEE